MLCESRPISDGYVKSNDGEELIIAGTSLLDELMPYKIIDKCNGFAGKEAEEVDEEIFYYISDCDLKLPDLVDDKN